jgi:hypothetical protein
MSCEPLDGVDSLRRVVDGDLAVALPDGDGGVHLHGVVVLVGRRVGLLDLRLRAAECLVEVALVAVGGLSVE